MICCYRLNICQDYTLAFRHLECFNLIYSFWFNEAFVYFDANNYVLLLEWGCDHTMVSQPLLQYNLEYIFHRWALLVHVLKMCLLMGENTYESCCCQYI